MHGNQLYYYNHVITEPSTDERGREKLKGSKRHGRKNLKVQNSLLMHVLTKKDLKEIYGRLKRVSGKWLDLGVAFKLSIDDLHAIKKKYDDDERRLLEMISKRLEVTDSDLPDFTWSYICECLRSPLVELNIIANEIEQQGLK